MRPPVPHIKAGVCEHWENSGRGATRGGRCRDGLERLTPAERSRLLIRSPGGLEPAVLWLGEHGMPVSLSGWKDIFRSASAR
jgi:hypothetical protein